MMSSKASLSSADGSETLQFRFNPREYSIQKTASWTRHTNKGALTAAPPEFGGVQPQNVSMELFFDDWLSPGNLVDDINMLFRWLSPTPRSHSNNKPRPQILQFKWGDQHPMAEFKGFLKSVSAKYTMFKSDGTPVRGTAQIQMEQVPADAARTNPTSGSPAARRTHILAAGETLHSIAYQEFDDPALWRGLADFNNIDDPLHLKPGRRLLIPTAEEAAAKS